MLNLFGHKPAVLAPATDLARIESDGEQRPAPSALVVLGNEGWNLKLKIEQLQKQLQQIKEDLQAQLGLDAALVIDGTCRISIVPVQRMTLTDVETCQGLLGGRFDDLVRTETAYTLSDTFKEILQDADHPLSAPLRACVEIKQGVSVVFRAARPA
ncbi:MAG: hypothetical protein WAT67_13580 [Candidatus Contendobacter sp.]